MEKMNTEFSSWQVAVGRRQFPTLTANCIMTTAYSIISNDRKKYNTETTKS